VENDNPEIAGRFASVGHRLADNSRAQRCGLPLATLSLTNPVPALEGAGANRTTETRETAQVRH
jgi:hypothetical protein